MNVKKWHQSEICIVINDKSQCSIAEHLSCDELFYYTFIIQLLVKEFLKLVNIWRSYRQNGLLLHAPHSLCTFFLRGTDLAR